MPRLARTHRHEMVGGGGGRGDFIGTSRGEGGGGEVTVLKICFFYLRIFKNGFQSAHLANRQQFSLRLGSEPKKRRMRVERNGSTREHLRGGVDKRRPRWIIVHPHRVVLNLFGSVRPECHPSFLPSSPLPAKRKRKRERKRSERRKRHTHTQCTMHHAPCTMHHAQTKRSEAKTKTKRGEKRRTRHDKRSFQRV